MQKLLLIQICYYHREELLRCLERIDTFADGAAPQQAHQPPPPAAPAPAPTSAQCDARPQDTGEDISSSLSSGRGGARGRENDRRVVAVAREKETRQQEAPAPPPAFAKASEESDFFVEIIIDELKRENHELKTALLAREEQLAVRTAKSSNRN